MEIFGVAISVGVIYGLIIIGGVISRFFSGNKDDHQKPTK